MALVALIARAFPSRWDSFVDRLRRRHTEANDAPPGADHELAAARARVQQATLAAVRRYRPGPFSGDVDLFIPSGGWRARARIERWRLVARGVNEHACSTTDDGDDALLREPGVSSLAAALRQRLDGIAAAGRDGDPA